jgi:hypothetical protein
VLGVLLVAIVDKCVRCVLLGDNDNAISIVPRAAASLSMRLQH